MKPLITRVLLILALCLAACGAPEIALNPLPEPDLSQLEEAVQRQLKGRRAGVQGALERGEPNAELAELFGRLGRSYLAYDVHGAAAVCLRNAERLVPEEAQWPHLLGVALQGSGEVAAAAESFARVLELRAEDLPALLRHGEASLDAGASAAAIASFERALELDGANAAARYGLGRAASAAGDAAAAIPYFEAALQAQPEASAVHHPLALAYRDTGERERAKAHLAQAGDVRPAFADPWVESLAQLVSGGRIHLTAGAEAQRGGNPQKALEHFRRAVELDPKNAQAWHNLGATLGQLGDHAQALESLRRAVELDPQGRDARFDLATALARLGQLEASLEHFDRVLELDAEDGAARERRDAVLKALQARDG